MDTDRVPAPLRERLGPEATAGIVELLSDAQKEWTVDVIEIVGDRFERRLVQETSALRIEMAQGFARARLDLTEGLAAVRQDLTEGLAAVRQDMTEGLAAVRQDMTEGLAAMRQETNAGLAGIRQEMANQRFDLLKWAFLFWIGQFFAVGSLIALLVRFLHAGG